MSIENGVMNGKDRTLTILIPGTKWERFGGWSPETNALFGCCERAFGGIGAGQSTKLLVWSPSGNNDRDRAAGAEMLRATIAAHGFAAGEKLNVIGHSHGGNVALAASHLGLAHEIENLITLNKPQMDAVMYRPGKNIRNFYNISAKGWDWIQYGGSDTKGHYKTDPDAVNKTFETSGSNLRPHAALIWDDGVREIWWQWFLSQGA